jgi:hypothetical protein
MNINEVFKKYPENEPSFNGINYMVILEINKTAVYSIEYFNHRGEWELSDGKMVRAFTETNPDIILNLI